jgi:hypothetical protein
MAKTINEFFERLSGGNLPQFLAEPRYSGNGDCIYYHWRPDEFYRDRIDDKLTVYRAINGGEAVGCQIKGVAALQKKLGDFGISVNQQDGIPLAIFLFVSQTVADSTETDAAKRGEMYKYILEQVGKQKVELALAE